MDGKAPVIRDRVGAVTIVAEYVRLAGDALGIWRVATLIEDLARVAIIRILVAYYCSQAQRSAVERVRNGASC